MYTVTINIPGADGDYSVRIDLEDEDFPVPQIGDTVVFDIGYGGLDLNVNGRRHWFSQEHPLRRLYVDTVLPQDDEARVLKQLESGELFERLRRCPAVQNVRMD